MMNRRNILTALAVPALIAGLSTIALPAFAGMSDPSGVFEGRSNHVTSGGVSIIEDGGVYYVELGDDFALDGGPDPRVALGKDGYDSNAVLGDLRSLNGSGRYAIPAGLDVSQFNEVWIWCEVASVPLGVASLN